MDPIALFNLKISRCTWTKDYVIDQSKLITEFISERQNIPVSDVGILERAFQRKLSITRDEWFRLCISVETERLKLITLYWEKKLNAKTSPQTPQNTSTRIFPDGGFLGEFVYDFGRNYESPDSFFFWSGAAAISAVARRHCFVRFGVTPLYPNLYVILVGDSGKVKKATPIRAAESLVRYIPDVNFIDRTSTERLPHDLSYSSVMVNGSLQRTPIDAHGFMCAEELVAVLDDATYNAGVLKFLIEWWDCPDDKKVKTLKHGIVHLRNVCISLLGGTTTSWLQGALNNLVAGGGMLNRTIFVCEDDTPKYNDWPEPIDPAIQQRLKEQLAHIEQVNGEFIVTDKAREWNSVWYKKFRAWMKSHEEDAPSLQRKQAHMLKLAMILALSENRPMEITPELLERADKILDEQEKGLPEIARTLIATPMGRDHLRVLSQIKKAGGDISWSDLLRKNSPYGTDTDALNKIVKTLEESDQVEDYRDTKSPSKLLRKIKLKF